MPKTRVPRYEAAMAMVNGLGFDRALRAITLDAAKILKIDDQFGSLEAGKVADLVLYDGDPFEHATHVTHVIARRPLVYDRAAEAKIPAPRGWLGRLRGAGLLPWTEARCWATACASTPGSRPGRPVAIMGEQARPARFTMGLRARSCRSMTGRGLMRGSFITSTSVGSWRSPRCLTIGCYRAITTRSPNSKGPGSSLTS